MQRIVFILWLMLINSSVFSQNTLQDYQQIAEQNSPLLKTSQNNIKIAALDSLMLKANYGFNVNVLGDASYTPVIKGWGYDNAIRNGQSLSGIVQVTKDIIGKDNLKTRTQIYSIAIEQLKNQRKLDALTLKRLITEQYLFAYSYQKEYEVLKEIIHLFEQEDIILKKLTQASVFKQTDYLNFKVNYQQNKLALQQKLNEWNGNYSQLNYLAGIQDVQTKNLEAPDFTTLFPPDYDNSIYADTYKTDSLKLVNDKKIIELDYKPKLSAYADGGYSSSLMVTPYKNFGYSVGLSLKVPIYDGKKKKMLLQQNEIQLDNQKQFYKFNKTQYQQKKAMIEKQIANYDKMITMAKEQLSYSKTLIEANLKQVPTGDVKVTDFILSINNYLNLKTGIIQNELQRNILLNNLQNLIL